MSATLSLLISFLAFECSLCLPQTNTRELWRFPNGTWLENIAVRPNGNLLIADATAASLWEIVPSTKSSTSAPSLVYHFGEAESVGGITELSPLTPDTYAVIVSNSIWKINLNISKDTSKPIQVGNIPAGFLNGIAALDGGNSVLISDSQLGLVWYLDIQSGNYSVIHRDETMEANSDLGMLIGINGLRVLNDYMYYSNSPKKIFCRVRIDTRSGQALGPYEIISRNTLADDFAIDPRGIGYLASLSENEIVRVFPNGSHEAIAGSKDSKELMSATSAAFGRTRTDGNVLYVTTGGDTESPVNDTASFGGMVMAVLIGP